MIQGVIFDWGGVLCEDPSGGFVQYCATKLRLDPSSLAPIIARHLPAFMRGLPEQDFWKHISVDMGLVPPQEPLWREALAAVYQPVEATIQMARTLSQHGIRIGLLTNTEPPSQEFHLSLGYDFFDGRVFSCSEGLSKPDPEIYRLIAHRIGLAPEQCLMVDDRAENIKGAMHAGMSGHQFSTPERFHQVLEQMKLLPSTL